LIEKVEFGDRGQATPENQVSNSGRFPSLPARMP